MLPLSVATPALISSDVMAGIGTACRVEDVELNGKRIRWRLQGRGAPLVLLHGGHGSWMHWAANMDTLAAKYTVMVPDMPGFHDSDDLSTTGTDPLQTLASTLLASLSVLLGPDAQFFLAGFSFGGLVAAQLAASTRRVQKLALLGPAGHGMPRRQTEDLVNWKTAAGEAARRKALAANLRSFMLYGEEACTELALQIHEISCMRARLRSKSISRGGALPTLMDSIECPILFLWGEHDVTAHPERVALALRQDRSDRDWCLVPSAGHWVQFEKAPQVNLLLKSWFQTRRA